MAEIISNELTNGRVLAKNTLWNFAGQILPALVAIFSLPLIIKGLGIERFSILTLAWVFIGYSGIFDLGISQSLTHLIAKQLGKNELENQVGLIQTALSLILVLGLIITVALSLLAPWITVSLFKVSAIYIHETIVSIRIIAISLPFIMINAALVGILEAYQKFKFINILRFPVALSNFLAPLGVLIFTKNLAIIIAVQIVIKICALIGNLIMCSKIINSLWDRFKLVKSYVKPLLNFGGWITVGNIISQLLISLDRFVIATMLSVTIVAYFTTPYDVIFRMALIPYAIMGVVFPALSTEFLRNKERVAHLYNKSFKYIFLLILPPTLFIVLFAKPALTLWLGAEFAIHSFKITQLIGLSIFFICLNKVSTTLIQASGHADITGKISLIELPVYFLILVMLVKFFGLVGVALALLFRVIVETVLFNIVSIRIIRQAE